MSKAKATAPMISRPSNVSGTAIRRIKWRQIDQDAANMTGSSTSTAAKRLISGKRARSSVRTVPKAKPSAKTNAKYATPARSARTA